MNWKIAVITMSNKTQYNNPLKLNMMRTLQISIKENNLQVEVKEIGSLRIIYYDFFEINFM